MSSKRRDMGNHFADDDICRPKSVYFWYNMGRQKEFVMIGRKKELKILQNAYESPESQLVAIYGRRRIGKTYLVNEAFGHNFAFHHSGLKKANMKEQLKQFRMSLRQQGYWDCPVLHDWQEAFFELGNFLSRSSEGKKVVFLDEMPWMDTFRSNFLTAFEGFWNGWAFLRKDILMIVCGSATTWILKKVVHSREGLHNRLSARIRLEPFTLYECREYAEEENLGFDERQIAECYMALGGVAYYWSQLSKGLSAEQNIDRLFFSRDDGLRSEFSELYASLFKTPQPYIDIILALGKRRYGLSRDEILSSLARGSGGDISKHLNELEECGFIRRYRIAGAEKRGSLYQLVDNFSLFYMQFTPDKVGNVDNYWTAAVPEGKKAAWRGLAFERLCLEHVRQIKSKLGISGVAVEVYAWRRKSLSESKRGVQIDLLLDRRDGIVNLCEMKYTNGEYALDKDELDRLMNRKAAFQSAVRSRKSIHLTMITSYGLASNKYSGNIQSELTMSDLFAE